MRKGCRVRYAVIVFSIDRALGCIRNFLADDSGQGLIEYALVIATVSLVAIAALNLLGRKVNDSLTNVANNLS
jgi:pilus assembly protein Flp/PilA